MAKNDPRQKSRTRSLNDLFSEKRSLFFLAAGIALLTLITFWPASKNNFINWDDNAYVFENPHLAKPRGEAVSYFFGPHYFIGNYIPLTMTVYSLVHHAAGLHPHSFHLLNIWLHLLNVLLVFWFAFLLSAKRPLVAGIVALFFGIHPLHVESVAWISELKDLLYSVFFISGLIAYQYYLEKKKENRKDLLSSFPFLAFLFFLLSLFSKPAAVVFPLVLLIIDLYRQRKFVVSTWLEKLPFFVLSVVFGLIAIQAQAADRLLHNNYSFGQKLLFASYACLTYLFKLFFPVNLSIFYPYPDTSHSLPLLFYAAPFILLALCYLVFRSLKQSKLWVSGFLFFLVNIVLVLQFISVGDAILAERYTYVSYIGLLFIIGMKADHFIENKPNQSRTLLGFLIVLALVFSYLSRERCKIWKDDDSLATDLLAKFPDDWLALNNKGFILYEQQRYPEAIELFEKAIRQRKDYVRAQINLTNSYLAVKEPAKAMQVVDTALARSPKDFDLLSLKGFLLMRYFNRYKEAIPYYEASLKEKPGNMTCYIDMSECYFQLKDYERALKTVDQALLIESNNYVLFNNKGYILLTKGDYEAAVSNLKKCLSLKPDYQLASENLAQCYTAMKKGQSQ